MRLTRSSSQTTGARTSSERVFSPQVRKNPPSTTVESSSCTTPSKRTRRSATSNTSREQSDSSSSSSSSSSPKPPTSIHSNLQTGASESPPGSLTRRQGARKSRQNVHKQMSTPLTSPILKESCVASNSSRGNVKSQSSPHNSTTSNSKSNTNNNNNNNNNNIFSNNNTNCTNGMALRGKKKPTKDQPDGTGSQLFDVEDILDVKLQKGRYYYLIKWKGYSDTDNTWEPEHHLPSDLLDFYFKKSHARTKNEASSVTRDHNNCDLGNVNHENTSTSSHSRVTMHHQGSRCKGQTVVPPATHTKTARLSINCPSPESASSSYEGDSFLLAPCSSSQLHQSNIVDERSTVDAINSDECNDNECLPCSSFQANSPPESNGGIDIDLPKFGPDVQQESSSNVCPNFDPLSLRNLKRVVIGKSSSVSLQYSNFELNDSLVPGKVVCIDKSPFGTGKMVLIKWIDHEPTTWLDYDFVKLKYPDLLMDFYEEILVIDSLPQ